MAVVAVFELPGMTQDMYQKITNKLSDGRGAKEPSDWPVAGLLSHTTATTPDGLLIVDVWESEQALQQFGQIIAPLHQEVGAPIPEPKVYPVFNLVTA
jgi:hypothetical protein